jgi:pimeloyl-ACP methyl ester carboxylesterase
VARDLDLLRQAVGDDRLHYYGFSFGTLIGLIYADLFAGQVGHLVLDGVVDPTASVTDLLTQQAVAFEASFARLDEACGDGLSCPPGGLGAAYDQVMADLEAGGPVSGVGPAELELASLVTLYDENLWPIYANALAMATSGDLSMVKLLSNALGSTVSFTAYAGVVCSDFPHPEGVEAWDSFVADVVAVAPRFGAAVVNELRTCAFWPIAASPARSPVAATGSGPILVVGTTNDPATPLRNAQVVAEGLDEATLVVLDADRHTAYAASTCVQRLVRDYFVDETVPASNVSC